jgi:hypothetical protein
MIKFESFAYCDIEIGFLVKIDYKTGKIGIAEFPFISENRPIGIAARKIRKGEKVIYEFGKNNDDFITTRHSL